MQRSLLIVLASLGLVPGHADVLELKNGQILNGRYSGGSPGILRFETASGVQALETSQVITLTFTTPAPAPNPAPPAAPAPAPKASLITLPSGTTLLVRMMDSISSKNRAGTPFTAKLEYDLGAGGVAAVRGGTVMYGKIESSTQARRAVGVRLWICD